MPSSYSNASPTDDARRIDSLDRQRLVAIHSNPRLRACYYILLTLQLLLTLGVLVLALFGGFILIFWYFFPSGLFAILWTIVSIAALRTMRRMTPRAPALIALNALMFAAFPVTSRFADLLSHGLPLPDITNLLITPFLFPALLELLVALAVHKLSARTSTPPPRDPLTGAPAPISRG